MISFLLTFSLCVFSFPSCHFGKLYGLVMALSAVFSLLQYPCFALVKVLDGDPLYVNTFFMICPCSLSHPFSPHIFIIFFLHFFFQVNIGLTLLSLLAFIHPLSVYLHCRSVSSQRVKNKAMTQSS